MTANFVIAVVLLAILGVRAEATPGYGYGPPPVVCEPVFVTDYKEIVKEVPVHHTVYKTEIIPTEVYVPQFEQVYKTVFKNHFVPEYVTTVEYKEQIQYITDYKYVTETDLKQVLVTETQIIPNYITETFFNTIFKTNVDYQTRYQTEVLPTYITTLEVLYKTQYLTNIVPDYQTVFKTIHDIKTVCPKPAYGY